MPDKIVNHFILADGSTAKYDAGSLLNLDETVSLAGYAPDAKAVGDRLTDVENLAETLNEGGLELKDDVIATNVEDWLDAHPEATTTVQDDSLTTAKYKNSSVTTPKLADGAVTGAKVDTSFLKTIENAYVTPEQFGAVGDGVTDDTQAWQSAVDSGYNVRALNGKTYKIGQINITRDIDIDCGMSKFIQTGQNLFSATGTVETTTGASGDYTHFGSNYVLSDANKPNYTGYAFLQGTNSLDLSRAYYKCGFPASFKAGYMTEAYPIDVTDVTVTYYTPITINIRNIMDIIASDNVKDVAYYNSIHIKYGANCIVENVIASDVHIYMLINIDRCLNTLVKQIFTHSNASNASNNSYMIAVMDSCFTNIENCELNNDNWHCITTGGTALVYKTTVRDCALYTKYQYAYCDHANAIDTVLDNITCTFGLLVSQNGEIRNSKVYAHNNTSNKGIAKISLTPSNFEHLGQFTIENVRLFENNNSADGSVGIVVESSLEAGGVHSTRYLKELMLNNVYGVDPSKSLVHQMYISLHSSDLEHPLIASKIKLNGSNLPYNGNDDTRYNVDLTNCVYELNNVVCQTASEASLLSFGTTGFTMPYKIYIDKTEFSYFRGNYKDIYFGTINFNGFDATKSTFTGQIIGDIWNNQYNATNFEIFKDCTIFSVNRFKYLSGQIGMNCRLHNSTFVFNTQQTKNIVTAYADANTNWVATAI